MATRPRFDLKAIPRYLWTGPAHIGEVLAEQGPTAASRSARYYSMALCLVGLAVYLLEACAFGLFFIPMWVQPGSLNLADPRVSAGIIVVALAEVGAMLVALWAAVLGVMAVFGPNEPKRPAVGALLWGIALAIFYAGVLAGLVGSSP